MKGYSVVNHTKKKYYRQNTWNIALSHLIYSKNGLHDNSTILTLPFQAGIDSIWLLVDAFTVNKEIPCFSGARLR